jgi:serine/threonine-protein kinase RsbW
VKPSVRPADPSFARSLPSRLDAIDSVCDELRARLVAAGLEQKAFAVELVAREFLNTAVLHGNRCNPSKRVRVRFDIGRRFIRLRIADSGPGFSTRRARWRLPSGLEVGGRGLAIGARYADRVSFNRLGNQVSLAFLKPTTPSRGRPHA